MSSANSKGKNKRKRIGTTQDGCSNESIATGVIIRRLQRQVATLTADVRLLNALGSCPQRLTDLDARLTDVKTDLDKHEIEVDERLDDLESARLDERLDSVERAQRTASEAGAGW